MVGSKDGKGTRKVGKQQRLDSGLDLAVLPGMDPAEPTGVTLVARRRSDFISCTLE